MSESFPTPRNESPGNRDFMEAAGIEPARHSPRPERGETRSSFGRRVAAELLAEARPLGGSETCIYFIQADGEGGPIKVGIAGDPHRRLASLQTANPSPLLLRGFYPGPAALERVIHRAFADDRLEGEWFLGSEYLEAVADAFFEAAIAFGMVQVA